MRVAALADIHGNLPALEAVLADVAREEVDAIVVVGDTVFGPWPAETFDLLESRGAAHVRGNADREVLEPTGTFAPLAQWSAGRLGERRLAAVATWPLALEQPVEGLGRVLFCHSTPTDDDPIYTRITPDEELAALLDGVVADVAVVGHTHVQYDRTLPSGLRVVNPGSAGTPYEGERGAYWALLGPDVVFRRSEYDVEAAVASMRRRGMPDVERHFVESLLDPPDPTETTAYFESLRGA